MLERELFLKILSVILFIIIIVLVVMAAKNICPLGYAMITTGIYELVNLLIQLYTFERNKKFDVILDIIFILSCFTGGVFNLIAAYK